MTTTELAEEVWQCLPEDVRTRVRKKDVALMVKLVFESIVQELMLGGVVRIRNFGNISATFTRGGNLVWCAPKGRSYPRKPNIKLKLSPAQRLKDMVGQARRRMRELAKEETGGQVRVRTGEEGREGEGGGGEGQVPDLREPSEW